MRFQDILPFEVLFFFFDTSSRGILLETIFAHLATTVPLVLHLLSPAPQALFLFPGD